MGHKLKIKLSGPDRSPQILDVHHRKTFDKNAVLWLRLPTSSETWSILVTRLALLMPSNWRPGCTGCPHVCKMVAHLELYHSSFQTKSKVMTIQFIFCIIFCIKFKVNHHTVVSLSSHSFQQSFLSSRLPGWQGSLASPGSCGRQQLHGILGGFLETGGDGSQTG